MSADSVLARTKALVPYLREQAPEAERSRRLPQETFDALAEAGILKMCAPRKYGGGELPFEAQCDVLAEVMSQRSGFCYGFRSPLRSHTPP